jgi:hypothetical protein
MIKGIFIMMCVIFVCLVIVSCEFTESQLVKEQAVTFERSYTDREFSCRICKSWYNSEQQKCADI